MDEPILVPVLVDLSTFISLLITIFAFLLTKWPRLSQLGGDPCVSELLFPFIHFSSRDFRQLVAFRAVSSVIAVFRDTVNPNFVTLEASVRSLMMPSMLGCTTVAIYAKCPNESAAVLGASVLMETRDICSPIFEDEM